MTGTDPEAALVEVEPGSMCEMHWHPTSDEWQYYISGTARMGIFVGEGRNNTVEFHPSDVGYVPKSIGHYIENVGKDPLRFLEVLEKLRTAGSSRTMSLFNVEQPDRRSGLSRRGSGGLRPTRFLGPGPLA